MTSARDRRVAAAARRSASTARVRCGCAPKLEGSSAASASWIARSTLRAVGSLDRATSSQYGFSGIVVRESLLNVDDGESAEEASAPPIQVGHEADEPFED